MTQFYKLEVLSFDSVMNLKFLCPLSLLAIILVVSTSVLNGQLYDQAFATTINSDLRDCGTTCGTYESLLSSYPDYSTGEANSLKLNQNAESLSSTGDWFRPDLALASSVYLDEDVEGQSAILESLNTSTNDKSYHLFSHGIPGFLLIDGSWLNPEQISKWLLQKGALKNKKHLNIYGCEFGKGKNGKEAVTYLESALAVTIAASDDITGIDGDWVLEIGKCTNAAQLDYNYNLHSTDPEDNCDGDAVLYTGVSDNDCVFEECSSTSELAMMGTDTLPAGTLIIAMDIEGQDGNENRVREAYGLAVHLLHAEIPLKWIINSTKTSRTQTDFSAFARQKYPTPVGTYTNRDFLSGPIAIFPGYEDEAMTVINSYGNGIRVYELESATAVDVNSDLVHTPKTAVIESDKKDIHIDILEDAGLVEGTHFEIDVPVSSLDSASCFTFASEPHEKDIAEEDVLGVKAFVQSGGNFLAQCAAIRGYQNGPNGASLFTDAGFVDNPGISTFLYSNPTEPFAQFEGSIPDQGGSVKNFNFVTDPPGGTKVVHDDDDVLKTFVGRIDGFIGNAGGYVHYMAGHEYSDLDADRMYLNAMLRSADRPMVCNFDICDDATAAPPSSTPTLCINTALTNITIATTGATGIGTATGLPAGVTAIWAVNVITISGTPSVSGTFNYSIPLTGACEVVNATGTITASPLPSPIVLDTTICSEEEVDLADLVSGMNITYHTSIAGAETVGGLTDAAANPTSYMTNTTIYVRDTTSDGCVAIESIDITVNALPTPMVMDTTICSEEEVDLADLVSGMNITYHTSKMGAESTGGNIDLAVNPNSYSATTQVFVRDTSSEGCFAIDSMTIVIAPSPDITVSDSIVSICIGVEVNLNDLVDGTNISFHNSLFGAEDPGGMTDVALNPNSYNADIKIFVRDTTSDGCSAIDSMTIIVVPLPDLTVSDTTICTNDEVNLNELVDGTNSSFHTSLFGAETRGGLTDLAANPNNYSDTTTIYVRDSTSYGCFEIDSVVIRPFAFSLDVQILLEGAHISNGIMHTNLNDLGYLPGQLPVDPFVPETLSGHPYTGEPWNFDEITLDHLGDHIGQTPYDDDIVDYVYVSILEGGINVSTDKIWTCVGLVKSDGTAEFTDDCALIKVNIQLEQYVLVEHWNHLPVLDTLELEGTVLRHDFMTEDSYHAFPVFPVIGQSLIDGVYLMASSNGGQISYLTAGFTISSEDLTRWTLDQNIEGYFYGDHNMNGNAASDDESSWKLNQNIESDIPR